MSKDAVKQMFGKMENDSALKGKYAGLMQAHQKDAENTLAEKLVELGKTSGFAFSKDDLLAARTEFMDKANSNKELTDGDLANVAGGNTGSKVYFGITSVVTFGIMCAASGIRSIVKESKNSGSCAGDISLSKDCSLND